MPTIYIHIPQNTDSSRNPAQQVKSGFQLSTRYNLTSSFTGSVHRMGFHETIGKLVMHQEKRHNTSSVDPKRFFTERSKRCDECVSP